MNRLFGSLAAALAVGSLINSSLPAYPEISNPFPNGRYQFWGRTNGASRKGKTNRLALSRNRRRKNRK